MAWAHHYTGIDTWQKDYKNFHLYANRRSSDKKITFMRVSGYHWMLGIFIDKLNYIPGKNGIELFTSSFSVGIVTELCNKNIFESKWAGSAIHPNTSYSFRLWRLGFSFHRAPKWLVKRKEREDKIIWEKELALYEERLREELGKEGYERYLGYYEVLEMQLQDEEANYSGRNR